MQWLKHLLLDQECTTGIFIFHKVIGDIAMNANARQRKSARETQLNHIHNTNLR